MIFVSTILNVSDNSGGRLAKCIHIYKKKKFGTIGDMILVSIKTYNTKKKIKKGEMYLSLIIRVKNFFFYNNSYVKFEDNAIVLLNKKILPIGTRLFGVSLRFLRLINRKVYLMLPYIL
jgi:large subunit ribosomal protein L14